MRAVWLALGCAACGRIGFDPLADDGAVHSTLSFDRLTPGEPLTSIPIPIRLDATRADLSKLTPETFHAFIGTTELPVEIESAGPPFVAWVLIPSITDLSTTITIAYGGTPVTHAPVWGDSYAGVWHMAVPGLDSGPAARASTTMALNPIDGVVGPALRYTPGFGCIVIPSLTSYAYTHATFSGWMFLDATAASTFYAIITRQFLDQNGDDFILGVTPAFATLAALSTVGGGSPSRSGMPVNLGAWHHLAFTFDQVTSTLYLDGAVDQTGPATGTPEASANPGFIGCGRNNMTGPVDVPDNCFIDGALDEVRFETTARSAAWIAFAYAADLDQVVTYGPLEQ